MTTTATHQSATRIGMGRLRRGRPVAAVLCGLVAVLLQAATAGAVSLSSVHTNSMLQFNAPLGGAHPAPQTMEILNTGGDSFSWTLSESAPWLSLSRTSGTQAYGAPATPVAVSVNTTGLASGSYSETMLLIAPGTQWSPRKVRVTLYVSPIVNGGFDSANSPYSIFSTSSPWVLAGGARFMPLDRYYKLGGGGNSAPGHVFFDPTSNLTSSVAQTVKVPVDAPKLSFWLRTSAKPSVEKLFVEAVDAAGNVRVLATFGNSWDSGAAGEEYWRQSVWMSGLGGQTVLLRFRVQHNASNPTVFAIDDVSLGTPMFGGSESSSSWYSGRAGSLSFAGVAGGKNPNAQLLRLPNPGGGTLNWTASDDMSWLTMPASGSVLGGYSNAQTVSVNTTGLAPGTYTGTINLSAPGALWSTFRSIAVTLTLDKDLAIINGDLEGSSSPWLFHGNLVGAVWTQERLDPWTGWTGLPLGHDSLGHIRLGTSNNVNSFTGQVLTVPANATQLSFWLAVDTLEPRTALPVDKLFVEATDVYGKVIAVLGQFSNLDDGISGGSGISSAYVRKVVDVSGLRGQRLLLRFRAVTDSVNPTAFRIDDVAMSS
jgi:hypothetical protein